MRIVWWIVLLVVALLTITAYYVWHSYKAPKCQSSYSWSSDTLYDMLYSDNCVPSGWEGFFNQTSTRSLLKTISDSLQVLSQKSLYHLDPELGDVFAALQTTSLDSVKAVILGQDPAPEPGLATGYAFDVPNDPASVPTMGRIMMELYREGYCTSVNTGNTIPWVNQGVLLLNSALTLQCASPGPNCQYDTPGSNTTLWQLFTEALLTYISANASPSAFILWGSAAQSFSTYIDSSKHKILVGGHPSPEAEWEDFFCQAYFYDANAFLVAVGRSPVDWNLCDCSGAKDPTSMVCSACSENCKVNTWDDVDNLYYSSVLKQCGV